MKYKAPLSYIFDNIIVSSSKAYSGTPMRRFSFVYRLIGEPYDLMSDEKKKSTLDKLAQLFIDLNAQCKVIGVPAIENLDDNFIKQKNDVETIYKKIGTPYAQFPVMEEYDQVIAKYLKKDIESNKQSHMDTYLIVDTPFSLIDIESLKDVMSAMFKEPINTIQRLFDGRTRFTDEQLRRLNIINEQFLDETLAKKIKIEKVSSQTIVKQLNYGKTRGLVIDEVFKDDFIISKRKGYYEPFSHDLVPIFNAKFKYNFPKVLTVESEYGTSYQAFINVYEIPTHYTIGGEWIKSALSHGYPVSYSIGIKPQSKESSKASITTKQININSEMDNAREVGNKPSQELKDSQKTLSRLEQNIEEENAGLRHVSFTFCIASDSVEELEKNVVDFMSFYKGKQFKLSRSDNRIDLIKSYRQMLFTNEQCVDEFTMPMPSFDIASTGFLTDTIIGDNSAYYIGYTGNNRKRVFHNLANAVLNDHSAILITVADLGGGKSFADNVYSFNNVIHGNQQITIDPKGGRSRRFKEYMPPAVYDMINVITIETSEEYRGVFDPYNIYPDSLVITGDSGVKVSGTDLANELASDIIYDSVKNMDDEKEIILDKAFKLMEKDKDKSMNKLIERMRQVDQKKKEKDGHSYYASAQVFADLLETFNRGKAIVYFGYGTKEEKEKAFKFSSPWTIIETQNIPFPDKSKNRVDYTKEETASVIINALILNTIRKHAYSSRYTYLGLTIEEAHFYKESKVGTAVLSQMAKMSRQLFFGMNFIVHSLHDLPKDVLNAVSTVMYFKCGNVNELDERLEFIGIEPSKQTRSMLQNLPNGHCLLKDFRGNVAKVRIEAPVPALKEAFSSTPDPLRS